MSFEPPLADYTNEFPVRNAVSPTLTLRTKLSKTNQADCVILLEVSIMSFGKVTDESWTICEFSSTALNSAFIFRFDDASCSSSSVGNAAALCVIFDDSSRIRIRVQILRSCGRNSEVARVYVLSHKSLIRSSESAFIAREFDVQVIAHMYFQHCGLREG